MAADNVNRSSARSAGIMLRTTLEERELIKHLALEEGVSVQAYVYERVFGKPAEFLKPGRKSRAERDEPHPDIDDDLGIAV